MGSGDDITTYSAIELAARLRERAISCRAVTEAFLGKIESLDPKINAFCTLASDQALASADEADRRAAARPEDLGSLHGIPVALKDLTPTAGIPTTRGSQLFRNAVPREDAILVQRLKAAGAIILGKTNTPEFGHKAETDNLVFGPTRNPWDLDRTPGGSSGGSAAAVAAGLVPLAEGSDGAGSIRIPAAMCGIFGFKPTFGRVPDVAGGFSSLSPFFHNGPLARSVTDACLLYEAIAAPHRAFPFSVPDGEHAFFRLEEDIAGARVAFSDDLGAFPVSGEVAQACRAAANVFRTLGCTVEDAEFAMDGEAENAFLTLWRAKLATVYGSLAASELDLLEPVVQCLIEQGRSLSAIDVGRANAVRERVWFDVCRLLEHYDLLICPTTAVPAFPIAEGPPAAINGRSIHPLLGWILTYPFNLTGHPVASVPCGVSQDGLPIGFQIVGNRLEDGFVLRASRAFEKAAPWRSLAPLPPM